MEAESRGSEVNHKKLSTSQALEETSNRKQITIGEHVFANVESLK